MSIRPLDVQDNRRLAQLIRATIDEHQVPRTGTVYEDADTDQLSAYFSVPRARGFTALRAGQPVGCCGIYPTAALPEGYTELVKLYLAPEGRGRGLGQALIEASLTAAREQDYSHVYLECLPRFAGAISLYEKMGFHHLSYRLGQSGHHNCTTWMEKAL
jgi:putative acetyltransferase